ncbi:18K peptidoglycan-associated outer membrane lipoprotein; Peptidoglycan-associated lipoprotein precursor; Outer membrane protein P6; OmpA/MotB precursor [uncultured Candidatus Thioglobus sp.]|nr:18K peptidoglycan-associated outer membrane lipoprotein; Peptidoglycan-associated lipoprotein precursor; Outer membrane protein P6; OmpA/MotB precursor [uncultured Candidatus Thioglobus sp.]
MKMIIILPLVVSLSACSTLDKVFKSKPKLKPNTNKVIIEDKSEGAINAVVREQSTFEWSESNELSAKVATMPESARESAVSVLKDNDTKLVLYFDYDAIEISKENAQEIEKHIQFMQANPSIRLRIEGHADERGTRDYNLALGENRALSVKEIFGFYEGLGARIEVISYGEENPQSKMSDEVGWQKNRRVEFIYQ